MGPGSAWVREWVVGWPFLLLALPSWRWQGLGTLGFSSDPGEEGEGRTSPNVVLAGDQEPAERKCLSWTLRTHTPFPGAL